MYVSVQKTRPGLKALPPLRLGAAFIVKPMEAMPKAALSQPAAAEEKRRAGRELTAGTGTRGQPQRRKAATLQL